MKIDEKDVEKFLSRAVTRYGNLSQRDVDSAMDRAWKNLQPDITSTQRWIIASRGSRRVSRTIRFALAIAALAVVVVAFLIVRPFIHRVDARAMVESGDGKLLQAGQKIDNGKIVSTSGAGVMLKLADGSRVEMRAQSELLLERADDGVRIRLNKGGIIVNAAKQRAGHLYVQTKDVTVSVVGTVFLVKAEEEGSRVAVIQGEVRVQQAGATETELLPGDQIMTKPLMEWRPVSEEFSWSRSKESHLALLQQSVVAPAEPREAFEVVSVRRSAVAPVPGGVVVVTGGEGSRGRGAVVRNPRRPGQPCGSGNEPVVDPRRFDAVNMTLHALVAWAYGLDCETFSRGSDFLFGGSDWTKDDGFDIQAVIPEGTSSYTADQFRSHNAPKLQKMLQTMLEDRFKLVVHREMKEMQVYVLTVSNGGPKFITRLVNPNAASPTGVGSGGMLNVGLQPWKEGDNPCCNFNIDGRLWAQKQSMAHLAGELRTVLGQPVVERTGLTGEFNYMLSYQPRNSPSSDSLGAMIERDFGLRFPDQGTRSIFAALEQDFGLHLESRKEKLEVLVIDRVEKPSEN